MMCRGRTRVASFLWIGVIGVALLAMPAGLCAQDLAGAAAHYNRGNTSLVNKEYDKAIADYSEAIRLNPNHSDAYLSRGSAWQEKRDYDKAIADFGEAIRLSPNDAFTYVNRGNAWRTKTQYEKAIADYSEAIRLDPTYRTAYDNRGSVWLVKNEYDKAIADHNKALQLDPKDTIAYINRGAAWLAKKEYDKAIADYNEVLRLNPKDVFAYNCRGNTWLAKKEYDKAIADYDETIRLVPKYVWPYRGRSVVALITSRDGAERDARATIERAGWRDSGSSYAIVIGYFGARRVKQEDAAKRLLNDGAENCDRSIWPYPIIRFLRREIDEMALLALAVDDLKRTDAHCFIGLDHLFAARIDPARENFRWVRGHWTMSYFDHAIAVAELDRLEAKAKP